MYKMSRDYKRLFSLVCNGATPVGFVDFRYESRREPLRDVCRIVRLGAYDIMIGVRGYQYNGVYSFQKEKGTEENIFITACEAVNLEWILP